MKDFERRILSLEARQRPVDNGLGQMLGKLTDLELRQLKTIAHRTRDGRIALTSDEAAFMSDLETKYGPL